MTSCFLLGGGWAAEAAQRLYGPFLDAAGGSRSVACVVLDEGDGPEQFLRWSGALQSVAPCAPFPVLVPLDGRLDVAQLGDADALLVCGGLTPAYADALAPAAAGVRDWLTTRSRPYAGFSAGAAVAAERAVVGGCLQGCVPVCPGDAGEDLDEVTVVDGLGLVPLAVDVHAAQWGTLGRLAAAVAAGTVGRGVALDEDTLLTVDGTRATVSGLGRAHVVEPAGSGVTVRSLGAGSGFSAG